MKNITYEDRCTIERMLKADFSLSEICRCINKTLRTLKREILRCTTDLYIAVIAHKDASNNMTRNQESSLNTITQEYIKDKLVNDRWSPMIISKRMGSDGFERVSHTYIYKYIQKDKDSGGDLYKSLTFPDKYNGKKEYKGSIPDRKNIHDRPAEANDRERIGDIETDLVVSPKNQGASIVSSVDRLSRFCCLDKVQDKTKESVSNSVTTKLRNIGFDIHTITSDNGTEFTDHKEIANDLGIDYYFADPYSSYQRGSIEQLNGLIRRFIPKGTKIDDIDYSTIKIVENKLNNRPREILDWLTPIEFLQNKGIVVESGQLRV